MSVSAFWHGVHAGYYLSFLTIPVNLVAEDFMSTAFRGSAGRRARLFDSLCWFFKMRSFEYMSMSFLLLGFSATLRYWSSIYFGGHVMLAIFILVGHIYRPARHQRALTTKTD